MKGTNPFIFISDLIHIGGNELSEVVTFINCDFHKGGNLLTDEAEVIRLSYLRNEAKASKAMLVSNVGFSAAASSLAQREKIALLKLSPTAMMEDKFLEFADYSPGGTIIANIERFIESQQSPTYNKVVVHRLRGEDGDGELIGELLRNPEVKAKVQEVLRDPDARRAAERVLNNNPELQRAAKDFLGKFRF